MGDYSSIGQQQSSNFSQSTAFAAALQRAKQIAAKIHPGGGNNVAGGQSLKRSIDSDGSEPECKKSNSGYQSPNSNLQAAAAVAARLAQSHGHSVNEDVKLPEKVAGLFQGRGSNEDELDHIQSVSNCKISLARDSDRVISLNGSRESVNHAKELITNICSDNGATAGLETVSCILVPPLGPEGYPAFIEIMVPGSKVGLVIGKGGETIKTLQEKTGAKMVIIQDGPTQELEKPLRITGEPSKIEHAKQLVFDLILDKDQTFQNNSRPSFQQGNGAPPGAEQAEVFVPKIAVGVVIGKGGEMIKKIQGETGCKLQFIQGKGDGPGDRRCIISGTKQQVEEAKRTIEDLIESVMQRSSQNNQNRSSQNATNSNYGYGGDTNHQPPREEVSFAVPASKCGIVIGRGGETIKLINQQSGAFCEMDRSAINPPNEKMFKMRGSPEQIEHARQLISEKIGVDINILNTRQIGGGNSASSSQYGQVQGNNPSFPNNMYNQQQQQQQQQWGAYQQQMWDQSQQQMAVNPTGQPDYSAQWIDYYKSIGLHREAEMIEQQLKMKQSTGQLSMAPANGSAQSMPMNAQPQSAAAAGGGAQQPDYSKQWAEYYRSIGKNDDAEAIENQIKAKVTPQLNYGMDAGDPNQYYMATQNPFTPNPFKCAPQQGVTNQPSSIGGAQSQIPGAQQSMPANYNAQYAQYYAGQGNSAATQGNFNYNYGAAYGQQQQQQQSQSPQSNDKK